MDDRRMQLHERGMSDLCPAETVRFNRWKRIKKHYPSKSVTSQKRGNGIRPYGKRGWFCKQNYPHAPIIFILY